LNSLPQKTAVTAGLISLNISSFRKEEGLSQAAEPNDLKEVPQQMELRDLRLIKVNHQKKKLSLQNLRR
jgi:hypothetical protein